MTQKTDTIKRSLVVQPRIGADGERYFVIDRATNTTDYLPGATLSKAETDALIAQGWQVSIH